MVLNNKHGIALVCKLVKDAKQHFHIFKMQSVVGSSNMYKVLPVEVRDSSAASFTRWHSPPLSVGRLPQFDITQTDILQCLIF